MHVAKTAMHSCVNCLEQGLFQGMNIKCDRAERPYSTKSSDKEPSFSIETEKQGGRILEILKSISYGKGRLLLEIKTHRKFRWPNYGSQEISRILPP